ncbi:MAG: addiction module protein [Ignavibacteriaceae bacterium]
MQIDLNKLTDLEKLNLINTIWESIEDKDNSIPVNESHLQILLERAESEGKTIPWDESKKKISDLFK